MFELLFPHFFILISIIGLGIASYTDLKTRMVSNKLVLLLFSIGLLGNIAIALYKQEINLIYFEITGILVAAFIGLTLNKLGAWAAGDTKLLIALAALNPIHIVLGFVSVFALDVVVFSIMAMIPYVLILIQKEIAKQKWILGLGIAGILITGTGFFLQHALAVYAGTGIFLSASIYSVHVLMFSNGPNPFEEQKKITNLKEGDIIGETITVNGDTVIRVHPNPLERIIKSVEYNKIAHTDTPSKVLVQAGNANGIEQSEIDELEKWVQQGKLQDWIVVKKSAAMIPAIFTAYLFVIATGGIPWNLLF